MSNLFGDFNGTYRWKIDLEVISLSIKNQRLV